MRKESLLVYFLFAVALFWIYGPVLGHYFQIEDYRWITVAASSTKLFSMAVLNLSEWLKRFYYFPLYRAIFSLEYRVFGYVPVYFYLVSWLLHFANSLLAVLFFKKLFSGKWLGLTVGLLFAFSASHALAVLRLSFQPQLFAVFWFLLSGLCFLRFLKKPGALAYTGAFIFHVLMLLTQGMTGLQTPFLFLILYGMAEKKEREKIKRLPVMAVAILPFFASGFIYLAARAAYFKGFEYLPVFNFTDRVLVLPQILLMAWESFYRGFLKSLTGVLCLPEIYHFLAVLTFFTLLFLMMDFSSRGLMKEKRRLWGLGLWVMITLCVPAIFSFSRPYEEFILDHDFRYFQTLGAAGMFALLFSQLLPFRDPSAGKFGRGGLILAGILILGCNAVHIRQLEKNEGRISYNFRILEQGILEKLQNLAGQRPELLYMVNDEGLCPLERARKCALNGFSPGSLAAVYRDRKEFARMNFILNEEVFLWWLRQTEKHFRKRIHFFRNGNIGSKILRSSNS